MEEPRKSLKEEIKLVYHTLMLLFSVVGILAVILIYLIFDPGLNAFKTDESQSTYVAAPVEEEDDWDKIENGIHVRTGLVEADGLMAVVNNCTNCHSAKLVTQNRMTSERWAATIDWMQETQNLWDLGKNEEIIISYLVTNYPVQKKGRRQILTNISWYELEE